MSDKTHVEAGNLNVARLNQAIVAATFAHKHQYRKGTNIPYITHPIAVGMLLAQTGCSEDSIIAGILHDAVEDTPLTLEDIRKEFGDRVAKLVNGCSEPDKSLTWKERKEHTIDYIATAPLEIKQVACADKLHNVTSMLSDYNECGENLWSRFNAGRAEQEWYYRNLAGALASGNFKSHKLSIKFNESVYMLFPDVSNSQPSKQTSTTSMTPTLITTHF